jgi:hypothetical protein
MNKSKAVPRPTWFVDSKTLGQIIVLEIKNNLNSTTANKNNKSIREYK